jgi:tetratricopeptide (TPR) repeat protein
MCVEARAKTGTVAAPVPADPEDSAGEDRAAAQRLGRQLAGQRTAVGITQTDLADRVHYNRTTLAHAETGRQIPARAFWERCDRELAGDGSLLNCYETYRAQRQARRWRGVGPNDGTGAAWATVPASLPNTVPDYVEREDGTAEKILAELTGPRTGHAPAVVAVAGRPGVGKTTLALHVGHRARTHFFDGQLFADLNGLVSPLDPSETTASFLQQLGVPPTDIPTGPLERTALYRAQLADRRVLVVCDNVRDITQIRPVIPTTSGAALLVTSRSRLRGLEVTHRADLDLLAAPTALGFLARLIGTERVDAERDAATEIVAICGHLPLAVRAAGAVLASRPMWNLGWFARRLSDEHRRLSLLHVDDLDVRSSFALSYDALALPAKDLFRMLGLVAARTFAPWMVAALLDRDLFDAETLLDLLVEAQLIDATGTDECGFARFGIHDLLRDYGRELVTQLDTRYRCAGALARLVDSAIALAGVAGTALATGPSPAATSGRLAGEADSPIARPTPDLYGLAATSAHRAEPAGTDEITAAVADAPRDWYNRERETLAALVDQAHAAGLHRQASRLAITLQPLLEVTADWRRWELTHVTALAAASAAGDMRATAAVHRGLGVLFHDLGRFDRAEEHCQAALDAFTQLDLPSDAAQVRSNLGDVYRYIGRLHDAVRTLEAALTVFEADDSQRAIAAARYRLGDTFRGLSQWEAAETNLNACRAIAVDLGDELHVARTDVRLAMVYRDRCLTRRAAPLCERALVTFRTVGERRWEGRTLRHLGVIARNEGATDTALTYFAEARQIFGDLGDRRTLAVIDRNEGDTHRIAGDSDQARHHLENALAEFQAIADPRWEARSWLSLAETARLTGDLDDALTRARRAGALLEQLGDLPGQARVARSVGLIHRDAGRPDAALTSLETARGAFDDLGDTLWAARALATIAAVHAELGQDPAALHREIAQRCATAGCSSADEQAVWLREW